MPWFKVDDKLHSHRKSRKAGPAAMGLWVLAGSWCADQLSDGFVPSYVARSMDRDWRKHSEALVAAGMWEPGEQNGDEGFHFHDWADMQPTRADVQGKREGARERMRRVRAQGGDGSESVRANEQRSSPAVTPTPTRPDPTHTKNEEDDRTIAPRSSSLSSDFDAFWRAYPRKVGKGAALKAYTRARRNIDAEQLLSSVAVLARAHQGNDPQFIPHPATWLNAGRWDDDPDAIAPAPIGDSNSRRKAGIFAAALERGEQQEERANIYRLELGQ